jgi:hypothetical protein
MSKGHLDAAASGAFLSFTTDGAMTLIEKMVLIRARERIEP